MSVLDTVVGLSVLSAALLLASQTAIWIIGERQHWEVRQEAIEATANVLESARACAWEDLTPKWAEEQRLPASLASRLDEPQLAVRVQPEAGRAQTRRVTVDLTWKQTDGRMAPPISVTALFSKRTAQ